MALAQTFQAHFQQGPYQPAFKHLHPAKARNGAAKGHGLFRTGPKREYRDERARPIYRERAGTARTGNFHLCIGLSLRQPGKTEQSHS